MFILIFWYEWANQICVEWQFVYFEVLITHKIKMERGGNGFQSSYNLSKSGSAERPQLTSSQSMGAITSMGSGGVVSGTSDADVASDPASSSFFLNDYKK